MLLYLLAASITPGSISRRELLVKTVLVEVGLVVFTFLLDGAARLYALWTDSPILPPSLSHLHWSWHGVIWGIAGAILPLCLLFLIDVFPIGPLRKIKDISEEFLKPILRHTRWPDYFLLSALAGFCEELFFRGWLQPFAAQWLPLWASNLVVGFVFACCHAITPAYFIIAWLISLYFGGLMIWSDNLLVPMVTHGMYDLVALFAVMWSQNDCTLSQSSESVAPAAECLNTPADPIVNSEPDTCLKTEKDGHPGGEMAVPFVQGEGRLEEKRGEQAEER